EQMSDRRRDRERPRERGGYDQPRERDHDADRHRDRDRDVDRHRDRDRGQDKERDRDRDYRRARKRSRSRSPSADRDRARRHRSHSHSHPHRSRSPDAGRHKRRREGSPVADSKEDRKPDPPKAAEEAAAPVGDGDVDAEELEMMKMMGIPVGFDSTKGKYVPGADVSGVRAVTKRQPRQYMNRRGGFNRPLPPEVNR
uniref:U4/U6.U5 small nuclear ribonucleoprotein 27kDa protein domain-containing protein n=4 Tax=Aegilops tauschii subsp. strangulata TaxID=200361 RepID=A0A453PV00_AEGTS